MMKHNGGFRGSSNKADGGAGDGIFCDTGEGDYGDCVQRDTCMIIYI